MIIFEVRMENDSNYPFSVMVEAKDLASATAKAHAEFPNHRVTGVSEKADVAMLIK